MIVLGDWTFRLARDCVHLQRAGGSSTINMQTKILDISTKSANHTVYMQLRFIYTVLFMLNAFGAEFSEKLPLYFAIAPAALYFDSYIIHELL
jgi:hypothetical protein